MIARSPEIPFWLCLTCAALLIVIGPAGCGRPESPEQESADTASAPEATTPPVTPTETEAVREKTNFPEPSALLETERGSITIRLFINDAPETVANFVGLAKEGYYDGMSWHRVVSGFMAQTGDPTGTGQGGETFSGEPLPDEIDARALGLDEINLRNAPNRALLERTVGAEFVVMYLDRSLMEFYTGVLGYKYVRGLSGHLMARGTVAMANRGAGTGTSQFFIVTHRDQPHLNGLHTVFGVVVEGLKVAQAIQKGDKLLSVTILEPETEGAPQQ